MPFTVPAGTCRGSVNGTRAVRASAAQLNELWSRLQVCCELMRSPQLDDSLLASGPVLQQSLRCPSTGVGLVPGQLRAAARVGSMAPHCRCFRIGLAL